MLCINFQTYIPHISQTVVLAGSRDVLFYIIYPCLEAGENKGLRLEVCNTSRNCKYCEVQVQIYVNIARAASVVSYICILPT